MKSSQEKEAKYKPMSCSEEERVGSAHFDPRPWLPDAIDWSDME
jgi:hypothetical protein